MLRNGTITFNAECAVRVRTNISAGNTWLVELIFIGRFGDFQISPRSRGSVSRSNERFLGKINVSRATARNSAIEIPAWRNWSRRQQAPMIMALSFTHSSFDFPFGFPNPCVRDASQLRAINHSRFHRSEVRLSFRRFLFYFRFATLVSDIVLIAFIIPGAFIKNVTLLQRGSLFSRLACEWSLPRCNENLSFVKPPSIRFYSR